MPFYVHERQESAHVIFGAHYTSSSLPLNLKWSREMNIHHILMTFELKPLTRDGILEPKHLNGEFHDWFNSREVPPITVNYNIE
ncbi:hypothetical protein MTR_3g455960 [Medicago truncatula]|uniref:Uncharacterized protein n=1 Tax=Medicago truncatula TaxID=3880 RepID=A0A072UVX6_MEDTR|nr:hypothetical protein MTR_3g455960 [Medicago truncatula]